MLTLVFVGIISSFTPSLLLEIPTVKKSICYSNSISEKVFPQRKNQIVSLQIQEEIEDLIGELPYNEQIIGRGFAFNTFTDKNNPGKLITVPVVWLNVSGKGAQRIKDLTRDIAKHIGYELSYLKMFKVICSRYMGFDLFGGVRIEECRVLGDKLSCSEEWKCDIPLISWHRGIKYLK